MSSDTHVAVGRSPNVLTNSDYFFSNEDKLSESLEIGLKDGVDTISIIIEAKSGAIPKTHPKLVQQELSGIGGGIEFLKLTRNGKLNIITKSILAAQQLLRLKTLLGIPVEVFIQKDTITSRFLLHNIELSVTCAELAEELAEQGLTVLEVRRFLKKVQNVETPTQTILVTVVGTALPTEIKLWYEIYKINLFHDKPRQCGKCYKFNHSTKACRSQGVCIKCSEVHVGDCPSNVLKCTNCNGAHAANDKECQHYRQEVNVQKFRSSQHLTIGEARRRLNNAKQQDTRSYASVVSPTPVDVVTKADLETALQNITSQLTNMVQTLVTELQQSVQNMVETIMQPVIEIIQDIQTKKAQKSATLAQVLLQRTKKPRLGDSSSTDQSSPMEIPEGSSDSGLQLPPKG